MGGMGKEAVRYELT